METTEAQDRHINRHDEVSLQDLVTKFKDWWAYLLSRLWIILIAAAIGGALGFIYAYSQKPEYAAKLSFALEDENSGGIGGALGLASQFGLDVGNAAAGGAFSGDNLLELMKSRSMIEKTLMTKVEIDGKNLTMADFYVEINNLRERHPELINIKFNEIGKPFTRQQDSLLGRFHQVLIDKNLSVAKIDKKLSIISVKVNSSNELFSKLFAERLVKEVSDFYIETKTKKSVENLAILQRQTDSVRMELNQAISGVATSSDVYPNPNLAKQVLKVPSLRRQVDVQANQAVLIELVKNLEISKISLRRETPLIQIIDVPVLPLEIIKVSKIKSFAIGGFLFGFLALIWLILKRFINSLNLAI